MQQETTIEGVQQRNLFLKISKSSKENTYLGVSFLIKLQGFIKKETPTQMLSCKSWETFKNIFSIKAL